MRRATTIVAFALSLLLLVAAGWFVWPRGNWSDTYFHRATDGSYLLVSVYPDEVTFERSIGPVTFLNRAAAAPRSPRATWGHDGGPAFGWSISPQSWWNRRGFWYFAKGMRIVVANK